jgi:hypothetical protein
MDGLGAIPASNAKWWTSRALPGLNDQARAGAQTLIDQVLVDRHWSQAAPESRPDLPTPYDRRESRMLNPESHRVLGLRRERSNAAASIPSAPARSG